MEETRTHGPAVVWAGPDDAPVVVVLDPAGVGLHGDLPASWRPLAEHLRVMWCRLPASDGSWREVDEALSGFAARGERVHLVAGAGAGSEVGDLIRRHEGVVGSAQTFAAPVPLGHPEVVLEVVRELLDHDVTPGAAEEPARPGTTSLVGDAASALRQSLTRLFDRLKNG